MTRTQIQLPDPLLERAKRVATAKDLSLAEIVRRAMESYLQTFPEKMDEAKEWKMPVLRPNGEFNLDALDSRAEADAIEAKGLSY